jgi:hypothetical protein
MKKTVGAKKAVDEMNRVDSAGEKTVNQLNKLLTKAVGKGPRNRNWPDMFILDTWEAEMRKILV